jgi:hypothetical protein
MSYTPPDQEYAAELYALLSAIEAVQAPIMARIRDRKNTWSSNHVSALETMFDRLTRLHVDLREIR